MVLEEHIGYVSDHVRLDYFRRAIASTVTPGDLIADVGCGVGVLGMMCLRAGAAHCWGIDRSDAIEIARESMAKSGLGDRYSCIRGLASRVNLPQPVDLIICDHVGYFGIDYGIIDMIGDACRRFLKPGGKVMPSRIKLFVAAAASSDCRAKAEAWSRDAIPAEFHWLRKYGVNTKLAHAFKAQDIHTDPAELGTIDLRADNPEHFSFKASLRVICDGVIDGLVGWFNCELAEDVWMTNSPLEPGAIDREQAFLPFDQPIAVTVGDMLEVTVAIRHDTGMIAWSIHVPATGHRQRQSNWESLIVNRAPVDAKIDTTAKLSPTGVVRKAIFEYVDGVRTNGEIIRLVLQDHPKLFPSDEEIRRFVKHELAKSVE